MQPDDIQGLDVEGTKDAFDEWWELEQDVDEIIEDDYSDNNDE